jgi:hypothetical protein
MSTPKINKLYRTVFILCSKNDSENLCFEYDHYHQCRLSDVLETIGPSNKYIFTPSRRHSNSVNSVK